MARRLRASNPRKATEHKAQPVEVRNIAHPRLWQTALKITGNRRELIKVESYTHLIITL